MRRLESNKVFRRKPWIKLIRNADINDLYIAEEIIELGWVFSFLSNINSLKIQKVKQNVPIIPSSTKNSSTILWALKWNGKSLYPKRL